MEPADKLMRPSPRMVTIIHLSATSNPMVGSQDKCPLDKYPPGQLFTRATFPLTLHLYPDKCRCTNKTYYTLHTVSQRAKTKHEIPGMFQSKLGKRVSMLVTHYQVPDYFFVGNFTKNPPNSLDTSLWGGVGAHIISNYDSSPHK